MAVPRLCIMAPNRYGRPPCAVGRLPTLLLLLASTATTAAYDAATLSAMRAANRVSDATIVQFRKEHGVVLREAVPSFTVEPPLARLGNPWPDEMEGVEAETKLAAALVSRLLENVEALRDPFGSWCKGWDNAYDHYAYWRNSQLPSDRLAMVVLAREPLTLTLCGYPASVVARTAYSSTSYPSTWLGADLRSRTDLVEPEIDLDAGDALVLDGSHSEGLGGLGGGHLVYRFEACAPDAKDVLWRPEPGRLAATPADQDHDDHAAMLQEFAVAVQRERLGTRHGRA